MSAGSFVDGFYELNNGDIAAIRVQPETAALVLDTVTNAIPTGPATLPVSAKVSKTNREIGIGPRTVTIEFTAADGVLDVLVQIIARGEPTGAVPDGYAPNSKITLPWFQAASWNALPPRGATGTYLAVGVRMTGKSPESIR